MNVVMGIDPSLTGTGVVLLQDGKIIDKKLIKSKKNGDKPRDEIERLFSITYSLSPIIEEKNVDMVVIEGLAFMARNTTAIIQLAGLNYMIRLRLWGNHIPFIVVAPTSLKKFATGKGNCPKDTIMMEVYKRWHVTLADNNICDAYCLAKIGEAVLDKNVKLTKPQQEVVELIKKQL